MKKMIIVVMTIWIGSISFVNAGYLVYKSLVEPNMKLKQKVGKIYRLRDVTKYGYVDKKGKWVIKPVFMCISDFDEYGYALATMAGRYADDDEYLKSMDEIDDTLGISSNRCSRIFIDAKFGFVNVKGEWIIEPQYDKLKEFEGKEAKAQLKSKTGFINREGLWSDKRSQKVEGISLDNPSNARYELMIDVWNKEYDISQKIRRYGIYDHKLSKWKIEPIFELERTRGFCAKKHGKWGRISANGNWEIKPRFYDMSMFELDGLARAKNKNLKWGLIDKKAKWVVKPNFDDIGSLGDNGLRSAKTTHNGKYGYIDSSGTFYIKEKYEQAYTFSGEYAQVWIDKKCGYINGKEKTIIPIEYDKCDREGNFFKLSKNGKIGLMDVNRHWTIEPRKLKSIKVVDKYMIKVKYGNYEGYTDINGKPLTFTWDEVENIANSK